MKTFLKISMAILAACFAIGAWAQESITMIISGNLSNVPQDVELVYSDFYSGFIPIPMDGGRFSVTISCNPIEDLRISFRRKDGIRPYKDGYTYYGVAQIFPEQGGKAVIDGVYKEDGDESEYMVTGAPMSERYCRLERAAAALEKEAEKEFLAGSQDDASLEAMVEKLKNETIALYKECIAENTDNLMGVYCFNDLFPLIDDLDEKRTLAAQLPERFRQNHLMSMLLVELRSADMENDLTTARPSSVNQPNSEGVPVSLLEICAKNKYVLLDFWASWCVPCIAEFPALTEAYAKYKDKGFEIYAISLDSDKEKWEVQYTMDQCRRYARLAKYRMC